VCLCMLSQDRSNCVTWCHKDEATKLLLKKVVFAVHTFMQLLEANS
jgi:hypothetical protein